MRLGGFRAAIWWPSSGRAELCLGACLAAGELASWLGQARPQPSTGPSWPLSLSLSLSLLARSPTCSRSSQRPIAQGPARAQLARLGRRQRAAARSLAALLGSLERALPRRPRRANISGRARPGGSSSALRLAKLAKLGLPSSLGSGVCGLQVAVCRVQAESFSLRVGGCSLRVACEGRRTRTKTCCAICRAKERPRVPPHTVRGRPLAPELRARCQELAVFTAYWQ